MKDNKKQTKLAAWLWYAILWCPCYAISQLLFRYRFSGKNHVPLDGPVLLVSNHQSNLDPVLVGLACPRQLKYLARVGLFFFPFNLWIRALGAFPIDRERGALAGIRTTLKLLKENNAVLIFPEGSRTYDGGLQPMLPGFCLLARRSRATLVPVAFDGAFAALRRGAIVPRPNSIRLEFDAPIPPAQYEQLSDAELTELVSRRIAETFERVQQELRATPPVSHFRLARPANRLLAAPLESALVGENNK
jgi:1-acyl-sn-glycerol-3-phosphate acyltransferase